MVTARRARVPIIAAATLVTLIFVLIGCYKAMASRTWQLTGHLVSDLATDDKVVALTFDDGPTPADLDAILAPLRDRGVPATFFVNGSALSRAPEAGERLVAQGHELANHTWDHRRMIFVSDLEIERQLVPTDDRIRAAGQPGSPLFRPPYGDKLVGLPRYLAAHDRTTVMWDVAVEDFSGDAQSAREITQATVEQARPGSIILLHPWNGRIATQQAIGPIIDELHARGYRFVTVSQALGRAVGPTTMSEEAQ